MSVDNKSFRYVSASSSLKRFNTTFKRHYLPLLTAMGLTVAIAESAVAAPIQATESDNGTIRAVLISSTSTNIAGTLAGLTPFAFGLPGEILALTADLIAKNTPPEFEAPDGFSTNPTAIDQRLSPTEKCIFKVNNAQNFDGEFFNFEESGASIFFVNFDKIENAWSELNSPKKIYHPNADFGVQVQHPNLKNNVPAVFTAGEYELDWQASTSMNYVMDVALPVALMASFNYAEKKYGDSLEAAKIAKSGGAISKKAAADVAERIAYLRFLPVNIASELGLIGVDVSGVAQANQWYEDTTVTTAINSGTQSLTVWDNHAPYFVDSSTHAVVESQSTTIEATDFGGVRLGRTGVIPDLRAMFSPQDDCGSSLSVRLLEDQSTLLKVDQINPITWEIFDRGPYQSNFSPLADNQTLEGDQIVARLIQNVEVVDTQAPIMVPPEGFARYSSTPIDLTTEDFPLGRPRVADLADPRPFVSNTAPDILEVDRRYAVEWFAEDVSGNITTAPDENPDAYKQYITIKSPGTNTQPTAQNKFAESLTSEEVEIVLTGIDTDYLDGRFDPLKFEISSYPENGSLKSPLYPFFIEDFRLSPVGDNEEIERNEIVRTSPLQHLADEFRLLDADERAEFLEEQICSAPIGSENYEVFFDEDTNEIKIPVSFVYEPEYVHVNDEGDFFIRDYFFDCNVPEILDDIMGYSFNFPKIARISKWSPEGEFLAMHELWGLPGKSYPANTVTEDSWPDEDFIYDKNGRIWFMLGQWADFDYRYQNNIISFDSNLQDLTSHGISGDNIFLSSLSAIATDVSHNLLYELHHIGAHIGLRVFPYGEGYQLPPIPNFTGYDDPAICEHFQCIDVNPFDMEVDSDGNLYFLNFTHNRIDKFEPASKNENGDWLVGEYIGWMGSCTANKTNEFGVTYGACNEILERSNGYQCTIEKCARADGDDVDPYIRGNDGTLAGQFQAPRNIEIDPNDVLYVADTGNVRVQRFGQDGTFAGVANSTGTGVNQGDEPGFILGNMGRPEQISVNSSSLHVMSPESEDGDNFVHIFKTLPFYDVTESTATIKYSSKFNFQGTDTLAYYVDDGIDKSDPATVSVNVERAFRAPEKLHASCYTDETLASEVLCSVDEDSAIVIRLSAEDLDGFLSTDGLDSHTFSIVDPASNGQLTLLSVFDNAAVYLYAPDTNFNGSDSFSFNVFDGVLTSEDTVGVSIIVEPTPDPVVIEFDSGLRAARGFKRVVSAEFSDIDADLQSSLTDFAWGDGSSADAATDWVNSGRTDSHGKELTPQVDFGVGNGVLIAGHLYENIGTYSMSATMANNDEGGVLPDTVVTANLEVIDATVVGVQLGAPVDPVNPETSFELRLDITNHLPQGWAGLQADNTAISVKIPEGLALVNVDSRCELNDSTLDCDVGDLSQGELTQINLVASIDLESARELGSYFLDITITDDGPNFQEANKALFGVSIADEDEDGVIDVDDAFPGDARYYLDSDGDGLADAWELAYGLNVDVADNVTTDVDGDGFTLLEEFQNDSYPFLAEEETVVAATPLASETSAGEDRFGQALAGGDLNQDGFSDLVIGSPLYSGDGAVFIAYGSSDGGNTAADEILPQVGQTSFGRSVIMGDLDGNGYPDIIIGGSNDISVYFNNGEILEYADHVITHPDGGAGFGSYLASEDIDGDGIDDLVATSRSGTSGNVYVYLSTAGGITSTPASFISATESVGDSVAIADIDDDQLMDILAGASANGSGKVFAFLGADNDWLPGANLATSFILDSPGNTRFGFSVASGADVAGDGIDDLVVGAYNGRGSVYFYDSADSYWQATNIGDTINPAPAQTFNGLDDGSLPGDSYASGDQFGVRVALGHLDTDAFADLVVGANRTDLDDKGQVQIFKGSAGGLNIAPQIANGATAWDMLGYFVTIAGDINGDGFNDIAAGAPDISTGTNPSPNGGYVQNYLHAFTALDSNQDIEADGVADSFDNCPSAVNTNQADFDEDGLGDVCDDDMDNDGFTNLNDNCPLLASSDLTDTDSDGVGNLCDDDDDNDTVFDEDDAFPLLNEYDTDSDGDGIADAYETQYGLNPDDASDAELDSDQDGRSNLDEFIQGSDASQDDIAPTLTIPADLIVNSTGPLTPVDFGEVVATDAKDGAVSVVVDKPGPFKPGRHTVTWQATDAAGNVASGIQQVDMIPQINFVGAEKLVAEDNILKVAVQLNGEPVSDPVTVTFAISGSAENGSDFSVANTTIELEEMVGDVEVEVFADAFAESSESIVFTMVSAGNAVIGPNAQLTLNIIEENIAPRLDLNIRQSGIPRSTVVANDGAVQLQINIEDANISDTHTIDWSVSDSQLVPAEGFANPTFTFNPLNLAEGVYLVQADVTDNGSPAKTATVKRWVKVLASAPVLSFSDDSDGDGLVDADEGLTDINQNGIDDYQESIVTNSQLVGDSAAQSLLQTQEGLTLTLGVTAAFSGADAGVELDDILSFGNGGGIALNSQDNVFTYPLGLFDFEVSGLPAPGASANIVIPVTGALPANAVYRKYLSNVGWQEFVIDSNNGIASAEGELLACPAPGSNVYADGLSEGDFCVQLTIEDGGPNDMDGLANGIIVDPSGAAIVSVPAEVTFSAIATANESVVAGAENIVILNFELQSNNDSAQVNQLTLQASGSGDDSSEISDVVLWLDSNADGAVDSGDVEIGNGTYQSNDGTLQLQLTVPYLLPMGSTEFLVTYSF